MCSIDAIILASGLSSRMGTDKLLLPFGGSTVIGRMLNNFPYHLFERVIVVYSSDEVVRILEERPIIRCKNLSPHTGRSASIRRGLSQSQATDGVMFLVADQPLLRPASITRLVDEFAADRNSIVLPVAANKRRNPVIFPQSLCHEFQSLTGDNGGRSILNRYPDHCREVIFESAEEFTDIDTPEEYSSLLAQWNRQN